jgi:superfamily I DNA/RNA helicase
VKLVYANTRSTQADLIARELQRLVGTGKVAFGDIAILYPFYKGCHGYVTGVLSENEIPYTDVNWEKDSRSELDISTNTVKVMTVHSSKGLEFPVVFLFAGEGIGIPESIAEADPSDVSRAKLAYVAMTRAQDALYVVYSKSSVLVDRSLKLSEFCDLLTFPDDFEIR